MRSSAGVGITPPNVAGAPKPASSVMISNTLGAPFGGTTRGAHQGFDSEAFSLISPPNAAGGRGEETNRAAGLHDITTIAHDEALLPPFYGFPADLRRAPMRQSSDDAR